MSPAEALFGQKLKDFIPTPKKNLRGDMWKELIDKRKQALARRSTKASEAWNEHTRRLKPLLIGDLVFIQNQAGNYKKNWERSGRVFKGERV